MMGSFGRGGYAALLLVALGHAAPACQTAVSDALPATTSASNVDRPNDALDAALQRLSPLPPPPPDPTNRIADDTRAALLGQLLFYDAGLSGDGSTSCATCHDPGRVFTDGRPVAVAAGTGRRNTPTLLNSAHNRWFFRDGRADSAWSQALQPLEDPLEMASDRVAIVRHLRADPTLAALYSDVFGEPAAAGVSPELLQPHARPMPGLPHHPHAVAWGALSVEQRAAVDATFARVGKALAAWQRRLVSRDAPFDRWVAARRAGDADGGDWLSPAAVRGARLFAGEAGCLRCHGGPAFTDGAFHNLGVPPQGAGPLHDAGRYDGIRRVQADPFSAAGAYSDDPGGTRARDLERLPTVASTWGAFQTPSLRNVALTAPYMHAGQFASLHDVLRFYSTLEGAVGAGHHGESTLVPLHLTDGQIDDLVAFLESLGDAELPAELLGPPVVSGH